MKQTAVEWLYNKFSTCTSDELVGNINNWFEQAKAMEKEQSHEYAEFAIRCDRKDMKILNFEDWIKLETFKSE
jgi:hypothetical protein